MAELSPMLQQLVQAAFRAGQALRGLQTDAPRTRHEKGHLGDLTTSGDLESQRIILEALRDRSVPIIAEEQKNPDTLPPEHINVDPLDGTGIYASGCIEYGLAIAYVRDGQPQCGVLYQPVRDALIMAERGKGCFRAVGVQTMPVRLTHTLPLRKTTVGADMGPERHHDKVIHLLAHLADRVQYIRMLGSAVGQTMALLEGQIGAYVCPDAKIWDLCAGALAVQEAGGVALAPDWSPLQWGNLSMHGVFAANQAIANELVPLTRPWMTFVHRTP